MKQLLRLGIFLLAITLAFGSSMSQAFNSGAHVYIAEQVAPKVFPLTFDRTDLYYGSIAPDISTYASPGSWPTGFCETHYKFTRLNYPWWNLIQKAFAQGWQIHSEVYPLGADFYAHGTCTTYDNCLLGNCDYSNGYVNQRAFLLTSYFLILADHFELAHFAIEVAIDLLLVDNYDHTLGEKLLGAALFRSPGDLKLLTATFSSVNANTLSSAESTFRNLVINYATALTLPEPLRMGVLGQLGVQVAAGMNVTITSEQVQAILKEAINLCPDYYDPVKAAIKGIIDNRSQLIR